MQTTTHNKSTFWGFSISIFFFNMRPTPGASSSNTQLTSRSTSLSIGEQGSEKCWKALANNFGVWLSYAREAGKKPSGGLQCYPKFEINGPKLDVRAVIWFQQRKLNICWAVYFSWLKTRWQQKRRKLSLVSLIIISEAMAVDVVLSTPVIKISSEDVFLTSMESSPFLDVDMTRMRIMVLRHISVFIAVFHVKIYWNFVGSSPTFLSYVCLRLHSFAKPYYFVSSIIFFRTEQPSVYCFISFTFFCYLRFSSSIYLFLIFDIVFMTALRSVFRLGTSHLWISHGCSVLRGCTRPSCHGVFRLFKLSSWQVRCGA